MLQGCFLDGEIHDVSLITDIFRGCRIQSYVTFVRLRTLFLIFVGLVFNISISLIIIVRNFLDWQICNDWTVECKE